LPEKSFLGEDFKLEVLKIGGFIAEPGLLEEKPSFILVLFWWGTGDSSYLFCSIITL